MLTAAYFHTTASFLMYNGNVKYYTETTSCGGTSNFTLVSYSGNITSSSERTVSPEGLPRLYARRHPCASYYLRGAWQTKKFPFGCDFDMRQSRPTQAVARNE